MSDLEFLRLTVTPGKWADRLWTAEVKRRLAKIKKLLDERDRRRRRPE
jgi:hypothetical protein